MMAENNSKLIYKDPKNPHFKVLKYVTNELQGEKSNSKSLQSAPCAYKIWRRQE